MLKDLSVSELNSYISNIFEAEELLHYVKVYGEVSGLSLVRGNLYFTLKDENAILSCIMFGASSVNIKDGDQVLVTGGLKFYAKGGRLNFYATSISPYGSGQLFKKFLELKDKLEKEGVFDDKYKKPLPENIKTIGVVTSSTGAVIHDIITVSHRRNPYLNIFLYPARVQGEGAEYTIIEGLDYLDKMPEVDVIIIARGGGSIEDMQPFNTEVLARKIISLSKPVISAVGHEVDYTICDFASSLRSATPSFAGEMVTKNILDGLKEFSHYLDKIQFLYNNILAEKYAKLDNLFAKLDSFATNIISSKSNTFNRIVYKLQQINFLSNIEKSLEIDYNRLQLLDMAKIYDKGFVRVRSGGKILRSVKNIDIDGQIDVELRDGNISAKVINKGEK